MFEMNEKTKRESFFFIVAEFKIRINYYYYYLLLFFINSKRLNNFSQFLVYIYLCFFVSFITCIIVLIYYSTYMILVSIFATYKCNDKSQFFGFMCVMLLKSQIMLKMFVFIKIRGKKRK